MTNETNVKATAAKGARPQYEPPRLSRLDISKTASGFAGAFESTFPGFEPQSSLQAS